MGLHVTRVAFVHHPVTDVARARGFYEGLLALVPGLQLELSPGTWWIEYEIAGQTLAISNLRPTAPAASLTLEVASLDDALAAVRAAGVALAFEPVEFAPCRMAGIRDPDGNQIGLHQRKALP